MKHKQNNQREQLDFIKHWELDISRFDTPTKIPRDVGDNPYETLCTVYDAFKLQELICRIGCIKSMDHSKEATQDPDYLVKSKE